MRKIRLLLITLFALLLPSLTPAAHAQTGMAPTNFEELEKIPAYQPEPTAYAESFSVDLRDRLPPVGKQSMGDCAAWAFGYAGKSFLEANDQNWKPDRPARIFSPTFIYNSLATGEQSGLTPLQVLTFLRDTGCATLGTTPYREKDFTTKPSPKAKQEAELFRISSFALLKEGPDIRTALQQGHIVQIGVRTNPIFNSGSYDAYTSELHAKGYAQRKPGQLHGFHALTIVGFDDTKQTFLVMNSWGTKWGQGGYCRVHYDVAKTFNSKKNNIESNLIDWAIVMYDVKEKVEVGPDGLALNAPLDKNSLAATGRAEYRGFDPKAKKHVYFFNASLSGQKKALDLVKSVEWNLPKIGGGESSLTATSRATGFGITGSSILSEFSVTGKITFADNTTREVTANYVAEAPQAENRNLAFRIKSRYWGKNNANQPMWMYEVSPDFAARDRDDVIKAVWDYSAIPNSRDKEWVIDEKSNTSPKYAGPSGYIFAAAQLKAKFFFSDGSVKNVTLNIPTDDPIDDSFRLESEWREDGVGADGRMVYSYQVRLRMPMKEWYEIDTVKWDLGPGVSDRSPHTHTYNDFTATGTSTRDFRARLNITRRNGGPLSFDKWIELGPTARFTNVQRLDLDSSETYLGRRGSEPTWRITVFPVGDLASFEKIASVTYSLPESYNPRTYSVTAADSPTFSMPLWLTKPLTVPAKITFKDGSTVDLSISATPRNRAVDGLFVQAYQSTEAEKAWDGLSIKLAGSQFDLERVKTVDWRFSRYNMWDRKITTPASLLWPELFASSAQAHKDTPVYAVVTYADGSQEWLRTIYTGEQTPSVPSDIRLQVRERFHGFANGQAQYYLLGNIAGDAAIVDQIESVSYTTEALDKKPIVLQTNSGSRLFAVVVNGLAKVTAEIKFKPDSKLEPRTLPPLYTRATAPRTDKKLQLAEMKQPWNSDAKRYWILYLDGWESQLQNVASVTYSLPSDVSEKPVTITNRDADPLAPFAYRGISKEPVIVEALITMKDKSTEKLTLSVGGALPPPAPAKTNPIPQNMQLLIAESPVPGDPDTKEFTITLASPIADLLAIREVVYSEKTPDGQLARIGQLMPYERWTDSPGDYAVRIHRKQKPTIQAEIRFNGDKKTVTLQQPPATIPAPTTTTAPSTP